MIKKSLYITMLLFSFTTSVWAKTIVFLGDSLTEGYGLEKEEAFPKLIGDKFNEQKREEKLVVHNAGVSGSTTASGLSRLKWFMRTKPDYLFLCLGANDGLRGLKVAESKKHLEQIIDFAKENKVQVFMAGMLMPPNYGKEYTDEFKKMYEDLAKDKKLPFMPFILEGVAADKDLNLADGIHPNQKGHQIMAQNIFNFLKDYIK